MDVSENQKLNRSSIKIIVKRLPKSRSSNVLTKLDLQIPLLEDEDYNENVIEVEQSSNDIDIPYTPDHRLSDQEYLHQLQEEDNIRQNEMKESLLDIKVYEKKEETANESIITKHIIPELFIIYNYFWYKMINNVVLDNPDESLLYLELKKIDIFYFWIAIAFLFTYLYDIILAKIHRTSAWLNYNFQIILHFCNYMGFIYFIIQISYGYTLADYSPELLNLGYYWLNVNYILLVFGLILILIKVTKPILREEAYKLE
jgi:hypothetical protein